MSHKANLGCGSDYRQGYFNVDRDRSVKADWYVDIRYFDIPRSPYDEILVNDVLEHLDENAVENITASLRGGGILTGKVPHYLGRNAYNDFQHCRWFNIRTFYDSRVFKPYTVEKIQVYWDVGSLSFTLPLWWARIHERVIPGLLPPTRIEFTLRKNVK